VNGKLTVFLSAKPALKLRLLSVHRHVQSLNQTMSELSANINQIIDNGMKSGKFLYVSPDIQGLTYLGSNDNKHPQGDHGYHFPGYGYAIIVLSIVAVTAIAFASMKYLQKKWAKQNPSPPHPDDIEAAMISNDIKDSSHDEPVSRDVSSKGISETSNVPVISLDESEAVASASEQGETQKTAVDQVQTSGGTNTQPIIDTKTDGEQKIIDLDDSSSVESDNNSNAPLLVPSTDADIDISPDPTHDANQLVVDSELNNGDSDDSSSTISDQDSKAPLLDHVSEKEDEKHGYERKSHEDHQVLMPDFNSGDSDDSSSDVSDNNSKEPLINN